MGFATNQYKHGIFSLLSVIIDFEDQTINRPVETEDSDSLMHFTHNLCLVTLSQLPNKITQLWQVTIPESHQQQDPHRFHWIKSFTSSWGEKLCCSNFHFLYCQTEKRESVAACCLLSFWGVTCCAACLLFILAGSLARHVCLPLFLWWFWREEKRLKVA